MSDAGVDILAREELLELACKFAGEMSSKAKCLHGGNAYSWDWTIEDDNPSKGRVRIFLRANDNMIAHENNGVTWIRPHEAIVLQQFSNGTSGDLHQFNFRPDTPIGIEPDGKPRPTLAGLIRRHALSTAA